MRLWVKALGAACVFAGVTGFADAQFRTARPSGPTPGGQAVGSSYNLTPSGSQIQKAAPQAGIPIGNPLVRPYDPTKPLDQFRGSNIDPSTIVTPISALPTAPTQNPSLLERLNAKLGSVVPFLRPTTAPRPTYTPGISRRNRDRADARARRLD